MSTPRSIHAAGVVLLLGLSGTAVAQNPGNEIAQEHRAEITPEVIELMGHLADDMAQREGPESGQTAKRLRDIRAQATLLV